MRIFVSQFNAVVGDLAGNTEKIISEIKKNREAHLIVFPELSIPGYPPQDLIFNDTFVKLNRECVCEIASVVEDQYIIVGFIDFSESINPQGWFKRFNGAALLHRGQLIHTFHKSLLPTYDVFDETRYFEPAEKIEPFLIEIDNRKINLGVEICEDLWDDAYKKKITGILAEKGAELVINISASPYEKGKISQRKEILSLRAKQHQVPMIYCNLLGGQDELLFDGHCMVVDPEGDLICSTNPFSEEGQLFEFDAVEMKFRGACEPIPDEMELIFRALTTGIKDYVRKSGFSSVVLGLSGGIDSALVAALAVAALGKENVLGLLMPSGFSSTHSVDDARILAENLGMPYHEIPIKTVYEHYEEIFEPLFKGLPFGLAEENLQARIRGNYVMTISNKFGKLALATGNKTEFAMGYSTLYGDMCGALAPIGDLQKTLVYELCRYINKTNQKELIPADILTKTPSAELRPGQFDPFNYDVMSPLVNEIVENQASIEDLVAKGYDLELVRSTYSTVMATEFKRRQAPPILKISNCAFGMGRRVPLVNKYRGISPD